MKKIAIGKFSQLSEISKWDFDIDQDAVELGTKLTTTWIEEGKDPVISSVRAGEYTTEDGKRILVDSGGVVQMIFKGQLKKDKMSQLTKLAKAMEAFKKSLFDEHQEVEATLTNGMIVTWEGELAEGVAVVEKGEEGADPIALPDGEYETEDGIKFTMTGGLVSAMEAAPSSDEFNAETFKTEISDMIDEKLNKFKESFTLDELFESLFNKQGLNEEMKKQINKVRTDVSGVLDKTMDAMTEMSKQGPLNKNNKQADQKSDRAVKMMRAFKQEKFNSK